MRFFITILFFITNFLLCEANTLILCPTCAINNFQIAIKIAGNGDTIIVKPGMYASVNTIINKPLTIRGENYPVIDGQEKDEVITIVSDNVTLSGLNVRNSKTGDRKDYAGIRLFRVQHVNILNCHLDNTFFGIYVGDSKNVLVKGNSLRGANHDLLHIGNGIQLWKADSVIIENNYIEGHRDGIYFEFAQHCLIQNNTSVKNFRYGMHFMFSNDDTYISNTFNNNGTGVAVMYSHEVQMYDNKFINNWGDAAYGLLLKDITNSIITGNTFSNNTIGVKMDGTTWIYFKNNDFLKNGYALRILGNCRQDSLLFNNFSGNTFDVGTNGTLSDNVFANNYWDKYEGYDLNKDGIGDVPYNPVSLYSVIIEKMPYAVMLLRSFTIDLLDRAEKSIPTLVPETIQDKSPRMKMIVK
jgi:nitrous oxidase accessory protein